MTKQQVLAELKEMGDEATRKTYISHGGTGEYFGVKVGDMKKIAKKIKTDHILALELMATNNGDAQYFAGMIANPKEVSVQELDAWVDGATGYWVSEFAIPGVAADSPHGWDLGLKWTESDEDKISSAGWATLANCLMVTPDENLDSEQIKSLLQRVANDLSQAKNRTRYAMNGFVIAVGTSVVPLAAEAIKTAESIGKVHVDMGETSCKVPLATEKIEKAVKFGRQGKKRKSARC